MGRGAEETHRRCRRRRRRRREASALDGGGGRIHHAEHAGVELRFLLDRAADGDEVGEAGERAAVVEGALEEFEPDDAEDEEHEAAEDTDRGEPRREASTEETRTGIPGTRFSARSGRSARTERITE